jgi:hypothetical protein
MANKIKTIVLSGVWHNHPNDFNISRWRVEKVTDSVEFNPNQFIEKKEVDDLCNSAQWKVTIVPIR